VSGFKKHLSCGVLPILDDAPIGFGKENDPEHVRVGLTQARQQPFGRAVWRRSISRRSHQLPGKSEAVVFLVPERGGGDDTGENGSKRDRDAGGDRRGWISGRD
jgi:hypothetical protein